MPRHIVLVGLPGSGKSTVGRARRRGAGAPLIDIDQLLVREMGMPVAQIFGMVGEARFREMERDAVQAALGARSRRVIVPGGGWAAQPGQLHAAGQSLSPYLSQVPAQDRRQAERSRGRLGRFWRAPTRCSGCGSSSRNGNRFTSLADYEVDGGAGCGGGGGRRDRGAGPAARRMVGDRKYCL